MASIAIVARNAPYYTVRVVCGDCHFDQTIVTEKDGDALDEFLQAYADEYEAGLSASVDETTDLAET